MTWRQRIYSFGDPDPRTTETYADTSWKGSHYDFFMTHNQDGWFVAVDEPDLLVVIYAEEVWLYEKID